MNTARRKRVLILSQHFKPDNVIGVYRALGYAEHLSKHQIEPTIVTLKYGEKGQKFGGVIHEKLGDSTIYRISQRGSKYLRTIRFFFSYGFTKRLWIFLQLLLGNLYIKPKDQMNDRNFRGFLAEHLHEKQYDLIIGIVYPVHHIRLCQELSEKFKIPFAIDFKDFLWDISITSRTARNRFATKVYDWMAFRMVLPKLKQATFLTVATETWCQWFRNEGFTAVHTVRNGFENEQQNVLDVKQFSEFTIGYAGNLKSQQDYKLFIQAFGSFLSISSEKNVKLKIVGSSSNWPSINYLKNTLPASSVEFLPNSSKRETIRFLKKCHLLWLPLSSGAPGWIPAKTYDYIVAAKPILLCPSDKGEVEEMLLKRGLLHVANHKKAVIEVLTSHYSAFRSGTDDQIASPKDLEEFSREFQVGEVAKVIHRYLET